MGPRINLELRHAIEQYRFYRESGILFYGTVEHDFWNLDGDPQLKPLSRNFFMLCNPCRLIAILLGPRAWVGGEGYLL